MQALIEAMCQEEKGFTAIVMTYDVAEVVTLADRMLVLQNGRIAMNMQVDLPRPAVAATTSPPHSKAACCSASSERREVRDGLVTARTRAPASIFAYPALPPGSSRDHAPKLRAVGLGFAPMMSRTVSRSNKRLLQRIVSAWPIVPNRPGRH